jgi:hypothetical protein
VSSNEFLRWQCCRANGPHRRRSLSALSGPIAWCYLVVMVEVIDPTTLVAISN